MTDEIKLLKNVAIKWEKFFKEDLENTTYLDERDVTNMFILVADARIEQMQEEMKAFDSVNAGGYVKKASDYFNLEEDLENAMNQKSKYLKIVKNYEEEENEKK